jgi:hypothetical protein
LFQNIITSYPVIAEVYLKEIGEEEYPQDLEHDKEFYQDDDPNSLPPP